MEPTHAHEQMVRRRRTHGAVTTQGMRMQAYTAAPHACGPRLRRGVGRARDVLLPRHGTKHHHLRRVHLQHPQTWRRVDQHRPVPCGASAPAPLPIRSLVAPSAVVVDAVAPLAAACCSHRSWVNGSWAGPLLYHWADSNAGDSDSRFGQVLSLHGLDLGEQLLLSAASPFLCGTAAPPHTPVDLAAWLMPGALLASRTSAWRSLVAAHSRRPSLRRHSRGVARTARAARTAVD